MNPNMVNKFSHFVWSRHVIHIRREEGLPKPWTKDLILQKYKFCNVYRELDTVTKWVAENWRLPYEKNEDLWFAFAIARVVNWPDTLKALGSPLPWNPKKFVAVLEDRRLSGEQVYGGAYMISTHGVKMNKAKYLAERTLTPMWKARNDLRPTPGEPLGDFHGRLLLCHDISSFMSGQIIADLKYAKPFRRAPDWLRFAASGPGSRRGLNRVMGRPLNSPWRESEWHAHLMKLQQEMHSQFEEHGRFQGWEKLHAQDLQNCLCEFDKYERVRLGEGRPKSLYPGV